MRVPILKKIPLGAPAAAQLIFILSFFGHQIDGKNQININLEDPTGYFAQDSLHNSFDKKLTFDQYVIYSMRSLASVAGFDNDLHRYDRRQDLVDSFARNLTYSDDLSYLKARIDASESQVLHDQTELTLIENELNQKNCASQLEVVLEESVKLFKNSQTFSTSCQLGLIDLLDSFGSTPSAQLMMGNSMWLGSFEQCHRAKFKTTTQVPLEQSAPNQHQDQQHTSLANEIRGRYCVANLRSPSWPVESGQNPSRLGSHSIKLGICLPQACNSLSILRHSNQIEALIKINRLHQVPFSSYKLNNLYCLPDEDSPLRQLSLSAKIFFGSMIIWFILVAYFSLQHELWCSRQHHDPDQDITRQNEPQFSKWTRVFAFRLNWQKLFEQSADTECQAKMVNRQQNLQKTFQTLQHLAALNGTTKGMGISLDCPSGAPGDSKTMDQDDRLTIAITSQQKQQTKTTNVDLSAIDGIKVLSMIWLISAHTMLFFMRTITNGRDFWSILMDARFMTIMAGIFPVDSFFTVTGVLTAYLKFNKDDGKAMGKLKYWIEAFVHRYLRFMPMYLIIFWYTRDVSQYIGFGPLWDYATADTSLRAICKRESALVPILFQANFKPLDQHCVKPAWYLANDYQYLLITPLFMALMIWSKRLGYMAIALSVGASLAMQFITVFYSQDFTDFDSLINFKPMFAAYVLQNLWRLYVLPYNRIAPYLIGLMTGHLLYCINKKTFNQEDKNSDKQQQGHISNRVNSRQTSRETPHLRGATLSPPSGHSQNVGRAAPYHESQESLSSSSSSLCHQGSSDNIIEASTPSRRGASPSSLHDSSLKTASKTNTTTSFLDAFSKHVCIKVWTPLMLLISIIYLPMLTRINTQEGERAKIGASIIIALMRFVWSLAIARLIYVCATKSITRTNSFIIRFLSSPLWKPWSKIGLSVLLIQWEIISYFAQTQASPPIMTISFLLAIVLICIVATYSLGLLVYLTIEFPLSQIEHLYIHPAFFSKR